MVGSSVKGVVDKHDDQSSILGIHTVEERITFESCGLTYSRAIQWDLLSKDWEGLNMIPDINLWPLHLNSPIVHVHIYTNMCVHNTYTDKGYSQVSGTYL